MDMYQGPVKGPFSAEEIREIVARANSSQSNPSPPSRTNSGMSKHSNKPPSRTNSGLKHGKTDPNCSCMDCRSTAYRDTMGTRSVDAHGNDVVEANGDMPLHAHVPDGFWGDEGASSPNAGPPRLHRTSTSGSSKSSKSSSRSGSSKIAYSRDSDGNMVQYHTGTEAPRLNTHLPDTEEFRHLKDDPHRR